MPVPPPVPIATLPLRSMARSLCNENDRYPLHCGSATHRCQEATDASCSSSAMACDACTLSHHGSALHVMLFLENLIRTSLIFNGLLSRYCQRALLVYHYPNFMGCSTGRSAGLAPFRSLST